MYGILRVTLSDDKRSFKRSFVKMNGKIASYDDLDTAHRNAETMTRLAREHGIKDVGYRARKLAVT